MFDLQLSDILIRCSSHPHGETEARYEDDGNVVGAVPGHALTCSPVQRLGHQLLYGSNSATR